MKHRFHGGLAAPAAVVAAVVAAGACGLDEPGSTVTQAFTVPTGGGCPSFGCGANSPVIDVFELHELSLRVFERNAEGFEIEAANGVPQLVKRGLAYELRVADGRISGVLPGLRPLDGQALVGATIPVRRGRARYALVIRTVRAMTYFSPPFDSIEAYTLEWRPQNPDSPTTNLCSNRQELEDQLAIDPEGAQLELMGMLAAEAVVFEGDRVSAATMTMDPAADDHWFNVGCAGHTLSKLRLTHNTVHGQVAGLPRAWEQRQATLKMLAADYCGTGTPFTVAGQPLIWEGDTVVYLRTPREFEARWTEAGAACVNAPRMLFPTPLGRATFPDIWTSINRACRVTPCGLPITVTDFDGADRISANP